VRLLKGGGVALALAASLAAAIGGARARAATNDPVLLGNSSTTGNPNLAEDATEVQYDGGGSPGVVFLAQADNIFAPSDASYPAAVAGWTTTNPNITTGVYGFSGRPNGLGVVGVASSVDGNGVYGVSASGHGVFGTTLTRFWGRRRSWRGKNWCLWEVDWRRWSRRVR
jgi:hypothetical protein